MQSFANEKLSTTNEGHKALQVQDVVLLKRIREEPVFGIVSSIVDDIITAQVLNTVFSSHMHAYCIVSKLEIFNSLNSSDLRNKVPIVVWKDYYGNEYVCFRCAIF